MRFARGLSFIALWIAGFSAMAKQPLSWQIDLHGYGYVNRSAIEQLFQNSSDVFFLDEKTVVVSYTTESKNPGVMTSGSAGSQFLKRMALLDAAAGTVLRQRDWGNADTVHVVNFGGKIAVENRYELSLFEHDLSPITSIQLPPDDAGTTGPPPKSKALRDFNPVGWKLHPSITGRTLTVMHEGGWFTQVRIFDAKLHQLAAFQFSSPFASDASDDVIATTSSADHGGGGFLSLTSETGKDIVPPIALRHCFTPKFLAADRLVVTGDCQELFVFDIGGTEVKHKTLQYTASGPSVSTDGLRFAVALYTEEWGWGDHPAPLQKDFHITVFDSHTLDPIFNLPMENPKRSTVIRYALSPSGDRLAVLRDGILMVYKLPQP